MNDDNPPEKSDTSAISRRDLLRTAGAAGAAALIPDSIAAAVPAESIELAAKDIYRAAGIGQVTLRRQGAPPAAHKMWHLQVLNVGISRHI